MCNTKSFKMFADPSTYPAFNDATNHDVRRRYPAPFPGPVNNMPYAYNYYTQENMNRHIMWVQQAYMQYMAQYMQMWVWALDHFQISFGEGDGERVVPNFSHG